jgi:CheY-like chemotaxis protein
MSSLRILIVDDNEAVRRGVRSLLSSSVEWIVCGEAADGAEAIEKGKLLRPDVVLMDVSMPGMDGVQATKVLRREVQESDVVIISQNGPLITRSQAREAGASACVAKSNLAKDLVPTLERFHSRRDTFQTEVTR